MVSQITDNCWFNTFFTLAPKESSKLRISDPYKGNPKVSNVLTFWEVSNGEHFPCLNVTMPPYINHLSSGVPFAKMFKL